MAATGRNNLPLVFGLLLAGGILLEKGGRNVGQAFQGSSSGAGSSSSTGVVSAPLSGSQKAQVQTVAQQAGLSPRTLWGVYGTETSFGTDTSTSSAGAEGPFQFLPSTWAQYGRGSIQDFGASLQAAARYLRSLGANADPSSPQTIAALNAYNGNHGGASQTSYSSSVLQNGAGF